MTLLDIGCGWGATMRRAMEKYDVNVIGLTLSKNEQAYTAKLLDEVDSRRSHDVQLRGWDEFSNPVDRIVSIEAFEHFGFDRYDDFFKNCASIMPADGRMTIQSTTGYRPRGVVTAVALHQDPEHLGDALEASRDEAVENQSEQVYDRYTRYLRGCQAMFSDEYCDVNLVTYLKSAV